jgi:hypothetical protein
MHKILLAAMFVLSTSVSAEEFKLNFTDSTQISHDSEDWATAATTSQYELYVNKGSIASSESVVSIYTITEFYPPDGTRMQQFPIPVKRIYSYGIMECKNSLFHLLNDWFVDKNNRVIYMQNHEFGSYEVDVSQKNTPRNDLFLLVCQ